MKSRNILLAMAIMLAFLAQSCREMGLNPWDNPDQPVDSTNSLKQLVGSEWRLIAFSYDPADSINAINQLTPALVPDDQVITLRFDSEKNISGLAVCNSYGAEVKGGTRSAISFQNMVATDIACPTGSLDYRYYDALRNAKNYSVTQNELRIFWKPEINVPEIGRRMLIFRRQSGNNNGGGTKDSTEIKIKMLEGRTFMLHSFVDAGVEDANLPSADRCMIGFMPSAGIVNFISGCNLGFANIAFADSGATMKLTNFIVDNQPCQGFDQATGNRFVDFLKNCGRFEFSDYGTTLTMWSSLPTFAESKMVLKFLPDPSITAIEILDMPGSGLPKSTYPMLTIGDLYFDGQYVTFRYSYAGNTPDFVINAYSTFQQTASDPPVIVVDLVSDGTLNPYSKITYGDAVLSLDALRKRITTMPPSSFVANLILRHENKVVGTTMISL